MDLKTIAMSAALLLCLGGCKNTETVEESVPEPVVDMQTSLGMMRIQLSNATPKHRDNFLKLVDEKFYEGIKFHRVIKGFMIQGGDPLSKDDSARVHWGEGGPGYTVAAEFVDSLRHRKGAVAAARIGDMANPRRASSGSQFYIVQSEEGCAHLDGQYTVFGQVIEGMDVIDRIASVATDPYDRPLGSVTILSVTLEVPDTLAVADSAAVLADTLKAAPSDSLKR